MVRSRYLGSLVRMYLTSMILKDIESQLHEQDSQSIKIHCNIDCLEVKNQVSKNR